MEYPALEKRLKFYYVTVIISIFSAVLSFSYNAWRLELSEDNSTIRTASFQVLVELAELEQGMYSLHYDHKEDWSPRKGWVSIALIRDLSMLIGTPAAKEAQVLHAKWKALWPDIEQDPVALNSIISQIDVLRERITKDLASLE